MLEVADKAVVGAVEGEAEAEAVCRAHQLGLRRVGVDADQVAGFGAAPNVALAVDRHAFRMRDARFGKDPVDQDLGPIHG